MAIGRRQFLFASTGIALTATNAVRAAGARNKALSPITKGAQPITALEHAQRIAKLQSLLQHSKVKALLVESGTTLEYFTGIRWRRSERTTAAVIPAIGKVVVVTPYFEEPSIREMLKVDADIRPWIEDASPFDLLAGALREIQAPESTVAVEGTTRQFIIERTRRALGSAAEFVSGDEPVRACRLIKSPAEIALLQSANDVTLAAIRHVHGRIATGMSSADIMKMLMETTEALGGNHEFSLVLLNEASAFPHGSNKPQTIRQGSVVLVDSGCSLHGYESDVSRSWIFGEPTKRHREIWNTVKRGQEIALETAVIGIPVGTIDKAVRAFYEGKGWSKDYALPGTSHRTGHGIGMDGHEAPYLVRSDTTPLQAGMCFSDEPGIYIPGEFGIRLEDCWHMTASGPKLFTPLAVSIDRPI